MYMAIRHGTKPPEPRVAGTPPQSIRGERRMGTGRPRIERRERREPMERRKPRTGSAGGNGPAIGKSRSEGLPRGRGSAAAA